MSTCPLCYSFCDQTVTIYRKKDGKTERIVEEKAYLQQKEVLHTDALGSVKKQEFLLVLPGDTQKVFPGDWIMEGIGPEIPDEVTFQPGIMKGLGQVKETQRFYWENTICHTEAKGES